MSMVKLVTVFSENKLGQMSKITQTLADAKVNILWVNIATTESFGVIRFLVNQADAGYNILKQKGFTVKLIDVLAIEVEDKPGGLHTVAKILSENNINVNNSSGYVSNSRAVLLIEVTDIVVATEVLRKSGMRLLSQEEATHL